MNIHDLKMQIHIGLKLLHSHFNISISAWINTASPGSGDYFYSLFGIISEESWGMFKTIALYQISVSKILELVVESESISSSYHYDPISIPEK
jgi:hypothetical protein